MQLNPATGTSYSEASVRHRTSIAALIPARLDRAATRLSHAAEVLLVLALLSSLPATAKAQSPETDFENKIRPVLAETCFQCHGDTKQGGGLKVDSRQALLQGGDSGAAVIPGNPDGSLLILAIERHADVSAMPPDQDQALRPDQIADFRKWIQDGAVWPAATAKFESRLHWAFQPIQSPECPQVQRRDWCRTPIDNFILSDFERRNLSPAPEADRRTLIRRVTFDLTGLPPSPDEVRGFLEDQAPNAFEKVVDRLLSSPAYGEKWGRHWLDVVRYADTAGETADYPVPVAWRYRNYVIDAFNRDMPYDQFLKEQIAGDILARQTSSDRYAEQVVATGFLAVSRRFGFDSENYHHLTIQDSIDAVGQSVMGLSLGCARCHDHKFDPISAEDYYALYGIFDSSRYAFPGSEQKQRVRAMASLEAPENSELQWREYNQRVAQLSRELSSLNRPVPSAILRSLNDMDGDFELQAAASGGSNGVLVPPWHYEGLVSVTADAQSPYQNVYPRGRFGVSIPSIQTAWRVYQAVHLADPGSTARTPRFLNLDFRTGSEPGSGFHRMTVGDCNGANVISVRIHATEVFLETPGATHSLGKITPNQWHNLQLRLSSDSASVSGSLGMPGAVAAIPEIALQRPWNGDLQWVELGVDSDESGPRSSLAFDNFSVGTRPFDAVTTELPSTEPDSSALTAEAINERLRTLSGIDGDFELQQAESPPSSPWNPGPNSVVKLQKASQSPYENHYAAGGLGIHLPNRAEYDGFGLTLPKTDPDASGVLYTAFDFRCADATRGGSGSWRFYVGHGPGNSAALEFFFNGAEFFRRSGAAIDSVASLQTGHWYQVQVQLNTQTRTYTGVLHNGDKEISFGGEVASGWDGAIDYLFIDSYGHVGGVRPALDADNFVFRATPLNSFGDRVGDVASVDQRRSEVLQLRSQLAALQGRAEALENELRMLLENGPGQLAYAMAEGTPHDVRIQQRGEPTQPGDSVPRGFIRVLGQPELPEGTRGSGRLELANWLTRPDHPLTARVMVNRIWQYHFGRGLVSTPNDFGVRGQAPSHPELLDYLATEFRNSGWSVKSMHRLLLLSATWQQSSLDDGSGSPSPAEENRFRGFARRRLSAEEIRDAILAVAGELDRTPGESHPFPSPVSWGYSQHGPFSAVYDTNRRSVYLMTQRLKRHPFLALFDGADPNSSTALRAGTTVPTQALFFLNDPLIHTAAKNWADRLHQTSLSLPEQIQLAWSTALNREPDAQELQDALAFLTEYNAQTGQTATKDQQLAAFSALLRTLIGSNEFLHVD